MRVGETLEARMRKRMAGYAVAAGAWVALSFFLTPQAASAASSAGCDGGGFSVLSVSGSQKTTVPAGTVGSSFLVKGKYVVFTVDSASFGLRDWTLTGAPNPLDITGEMPTIVFASKIPDHRGLALTGDVSVEGSCEKLVISRTGPGLSMKIQVKDCANGGVFQMEPARPDGTVTVTARVNFANDFSEKFVGRDSPQSATRIATDCANAIPNPFHPGTVS